MVGSQRRAEVRLRESEERFRLLVESVSVSSFRVMLR